MDKRLILAGAAVMVIFLSGYFYFSNNIPEYKPGVSEFRERTKCDQFLTENDLESVIGDKWVSPSNLVKIQGDICSVTFESNGKSLELSTSPSFISGVDVYGLLRSRLKDNEQISDTNELGDGSFRISTGKVNKVVFLKGNTVFIISGSGVDFKEIIEIGKIVQEDFALAKS